MIEHVKLLREMGLPVPPPQTQLSVLIRNEVKTSSASLKELAPA